MSMKAFEGAVSAILAKAKIQGKVWFKHDTDKGMYTAYCPGNIRITANSVNTKLTVRWGSGHQAMVPASV